MRRRLNVGSESSGRCERRVSQNLRARRVRERLSRPGSAGELPFRRNGYVLCRQNFRWRFRGDERCISKSARHALSGAEPRTLFVKLFALMCNEAERRRVPFPGGVLRYILCCICGIGCIGCAPGAVLYRFTKISGESSFFIACITPILPDFF